MLAHARAPLVRLSHLDDLWFQVAGTLCNLTCRHCFISCSPKNDKFGFLSLDDLRRALRDSVELGVKEYYFTGGEPFMHRDIVAMLIETLCFGPATVLTNATLFKDTALAELAAAERDSLYSLEFRVSIDGFLPETNDPIRGPGTFDRAMRGVAQLVDHGFLPIITAARTWPLDEEHTVVARFVDALRAAGYDRPRLKIIPTLRIGAEATRTRPYQEDERVTLEMMQGYDASQLICEHSRVVTDQGVYVCPILLDFPAARVGNDLRTARTEFPLAFGACVTCYEHGAICTNPSAGMRR
jgi:MoaA/NifB/PqqE/SkfB family radical SAM enzyme